MNMIQGVLKLYKDSDNVYWPAFLENGKSDSEMLLLEFGDTIQVSDPYGNFAESRFHGALQGEMVDVTTVRFTTREYMIPTAIKITSILAVDKHGSIIRERKDRDWVDLNNAWWYEIMSDSDRPARLFLDD